MQQLQMMIVIVIVNVGKASTSIVDRSGLLGLICYARAQGSHQNIVKHLSLLSVCLTDCLKQISRKINHNLRAEIFSLL